MPQLLAPAPAATTFSSTGTTTDVCPAWCHSGPHQDGTEHFGGMFDLDLSLAEPGYVTSGGTTTSVSDFLTVALWQRDAHDAPVIGMAAGLDDREMPDLTIAEAERLAHALLALVRRAHSA